MADEGLVQQVAGELAIRNLIARLAQLADDGDLDEYIQLFTDDARWDAGAAFGCRTGHDEIRAGAVERRASGTAGPGTHTRHVITTSVVSAQGDSGTGRSVFHFYRKTDGVPELALIGIYEDAFERTERGWCLAHRKIVGARQPDAAR